MADFPNTVYEPRTVENVSGTSYEPSETTKIFAEDVNYANDEIVSLEYWTNIILKRMITFGDLYSASSSAPGTGVIPRGGDLLLQTPPGSTASRYYEFGDTLYINSISESKSFYTRFSFYVTSLTDQYALLGLGNPNLSFSPQFIGIEIDDSQVNFVFGNSVGTKITTSLFTATAYEDYLVEIYRLPDSDRIKCIINNVEVADVEWSFDTMTDVPLWGAGFQNLENGIKNLNVSSIGIAIW